MLSTSWRDTALFKLKNRPASLALKTISDETTLPIEWLRKFQQGGLIEPSVNRIQTLLEYFERISSDV